MSASMMRTNMSTAMFMKGQEIMTTMMGGNSFDAVVTTTVNTNTAIETLLKTSNNNARTLAALQYLLDPCPEDDR